jgi:hypothetical protein
LNFAILLIGTTFLDMSDCSRKLKGSDESVDQKKKKKSAIASERLDNRKVKKGPLERATFLAYMKEKRKTLKAQKPRGVVDILVRALRKLDWI